MIPVAVGAAMASRMKKENAVVLNYIGDGGCNVGDFHEGLNMAAVMRLPFVLIVENNQFAYSTPVAKQHAAEKISDRALGYGIPGVTIDGTDLLAVYEATRTAVERARRGEGPTLIESVTMRMQGHSASDDASYVPPALLEEWKAKDPVLRFEQQLEQGGVLTAAVRSATEARIAQGIDNALHVALEDPSPDGSDALRGVYAT
jgi:TPP-dependent pyruvate/acetoin dehydrogenase alpha subunit